MEKGQNNIPSLDLQHQGEVTDFAIRNANHILLEKNGHFEVPHRHNYYTILWSKNKSGIHKIDYKSYSLEQNSIFFVHPGQVHQVLHTSPPEVVVLLFTNNFLNKYSIHQSFISNISLFNDILDNSPVIVAEESIAKLSFFTNEIEKLFYSNNVLKMEAIAAYLKLFLIECCSSSKKATDDTQPQNATGVLLQEFKFLLDLHIKEWHKVNYYADKMNISSDYLNLLVKQTFGKTAKEMIVQRLIIEAKRLGVHTSMSSKEIAYNLGFDDPSHFSRFFKKMEGVSFTQFRDKIFESADVVVR